MIGSTLNVLFALTKVATVAPQSCTTPEFWLCNYLWYPRVTLNELKDSQYPLLDKKDREG